jgi:Bacterial EndoU nuclease
LQCNASLTILAILAAIPTTVLTADTAKEQLCEYTIDEEHIFYPVVYPNRLAGFHSTYRADQSAEEVYYWVTEPPADADYMPFSAEYGVPSQQNLDKSSSFFPIDIDDHGVLEIIGKAYVNGGCPQNAYWNGIGSDSFTGITIRVEGYAENHRIKTAYPFGFENEGD